MSLLTALLFVATGIAALAVGGDVLIRGSATLARLARVSPAVIGLTVVAMGTSLPELAVSLLAASRGSPDVAVANAVGSNIFNIVGILGITAFFVRIPVRGNAIKLEWPFMLVSSFVALLLARDGRIDRLEGAFLATSLILFTTYVVHLARREVTPVETERLQGEVDELSRPSLARGVTVNLGLVLLGVGLLVGGGRALVDGAVALATRAGVSERIIGLTVVAFGTSLPELAASLSAAYRRQTEMALANIIGSNIFNMLGILGVTSLVKPLTVAPQIISSDMWWMIGISLLLFPVMRTRYLIGRLEGAVLVTALGVYLAVLAR